MGKHLNDERRKKSIKKLNRQVKDIFQENPSKTKGKEKHNYRHKSFKIQIQESARGKGKGKEIPWRGHAQQDFGRGSTRTKGSMVLWNKGLQAGKEIHGRKGYRDVKGSTQEEGHGVSTLNRILGGEVQEIQESTGIWSEAQTKQQSLAGK